jgi:hypothetical protein
MAAPGWRGSARVNGMPEDYEAPEGSGFVVATTGVRGRHDPHGRWEGRWMPERRGPSSLPSNAVVVLVDRLVIASEGEVTLVAWEELEPSGVFWTKQQDPNHTVQVPLYRNWLDVRFAKDGERRVTGRLAVEVGLLHADPRLVRALITYYRDHPEERAELRTTEWQVRAEALKLAFGA